MHQAAEDLVDALRGTTNLVGVIGFATDARQEAEMTDVSDEADRKLVKDRIDGLGILTDEEGGTNWEAGLAMAASLDPDVVVLVTDGQPSVHGVPADLTSRPEDPLNITAAVDASDRLKQAGARVVGVGLGLDEIAGGQANLIAVTGPALGDDYYTTGVHDLLPALYDVASKSCAVPVSALPAPQRDGLPIVPLAVGTAAALSAIIVAGLLLARRRNGGPVPQSYPRPKTVLADPSIRLDDIPPPQPSSTLASSEERPTVQPSSDRTAEKSPGAPERPLRPTRRIKISPPPPRGRDHDAPRD